MDQKLYIQSQILGSSKWLPNRGAAGLIKGIRSQGRRKFIDHPVFADIHSLLGQNGGVKIWQMFSTEADRNC